MPFAWDFPYPTQRMPLLAENAVATSQPLAAQAGLWMLRTGGNAVDAALATAAALTVVEPTSNGIGSDAFAVVWDGKRLHGLNGSGRSPRAVCFEDFAGRPAMPLRGWEAVTVPGAVAAWVSLSERFGARPLADCLEPAIRYARDGFPVSPKIAKAWALAPKIYADFPDFAETFLPEGRAPKPGERFRAPAMAETLETIASTKGEAFYRGILAERIAACAKKAGAALALDDLASHESEWVAPLSHPYRENVIVELPPNGQGLTALIALGILEHTGLADCPVDSADSLHLQIEAVKLAFTDAYAHIADPARMKVDPKAFLEPAYLSKRAASIRMDRAGEPEAGIPAEGGTVYLATGDESGMMVSFIQSNFHGFGSGVVVPGTGISLQNRGAGFVLDPGHPNLVDGGKRPFHTIIPGFVMGDEKPLMAFGVMGGSMQPQGHVQMAVRLFDHGQNPQAAMDAPRWCVLGERRVAVEPGIPAEVLASLEARGHEPVRDVPEARFGGAQVVARLDGGYLAASEPRKDGTAVGF
jgi:gamma-glutamyltranspeptidase/glutathione hydrolase